MITQLRDVRTAWQSAEVAMKDHEEPVTPEVFKPAGDAAAVAEGEGDGRFAFETFQESFPTL